MTDLAQGHNAVILIILKCHLKSAADGMRCALRHGSKVDPKTKGQVQSFIQLRPVGSLKYWQGVRFTHLILSFINYYNARGVKASG